MNKYIVTAVIPATFVVEANTPDHAAVKILTMIDTSVVMLQPPFDGSEFSLAMITDIKEYKETNNRDEQ